MKSLKFDYDDVREEDRKIKEAEFDRQWKLSWEIKDVDGNVKAFSKEVKVAVI